MPICTSEHLAPAAVCGRDKPGQHVLRDQDSLELRTGARLMSAQSVLKNVSPEQGQLRRLFGRADPGQRPPDLGNKLDLA